MVPPSPCGGPTLLFLPATQVHVAVSHFKVKLYLDCKKIAEKPLHSLGSISTAGFIMLGKVTRTRGPRSGSAAVSPPTMGAVGHFGRLRFGAGWDGQMERSTSLHHLSSEHLPALL